MRTLACLLLLLASPPPASTDAPAAPLLPRTVTFRDGSVLRLQIPDAPMTLGDGPARRLSSVHTLTLARERPGALWGRVRALVTQLGDPRYRIREAASRALLPLAGRCRASLERLAQASTDLEVRRRIEVALARAPQAPPGGGLDGVRVSADGAWAHGDAGDWRVVGRWGRTALVLDRTRVAQVSMAAPRGPAENAVVGPARHRRLARHDDPAFGARPTRIAFDAAPDGRRLRAGEDVARVFEPLGVRLATSIEGAIVSVNTYSVGGHSRGMSCATHQPLYQGTLTARFCLPGRPGLPAGVRRVGVWVAAVSPNGTWLDAYDARDRRIARIATTRGSSDFLGLESSVPIAYVKIVPNPAVDPDFTMDDLTFDAPRPLGASGDPDRHVVWLRGAQQLRCRTVVPAGDAVRLTGLGIGVATVEVPRADVTRVLTPLAGHRPAPHAAGLWVRLRDGSTLRAVVTPRGPALASAPAVPLKLADLAALWSDAAVYREPPRPPAAGAGMMAAHSGWTEVRGVELGADALEGDGRRLVYATTRIVWVGPVPTVAPTRGHVALANGSRYVLGGRVRLVEWTAGGVRLRVGEQTITVPTARITELRFDSPR